MRFDQECANLVNEHILFAYLLKYFKFVVTSRQMWFSCFFSCWAQRGGVAFLFAATQMYIGHRGWEENDEGKITLCAKQM